MYAVSARFLAALRASHTAVVKVDSYRAGALVHADLPITGGEVKIDASSGVRRQLTLDIADPALAPPPGDVNTSPLSPFSSELRASRGIRFPDGTTEWVPLGRFRVDSVTLPVRPNTLTVNGTDASRRVADAKFLTPTQSVTTNKVPAEIRRLIQAVIPGQTVTDLTGSTVNAPDLVWETERWGAITDLATSIGAECYVNADGDFIVRPIPTITGNPAWWVDYGESGVLIDADRETNRESTYNAVVATGERTDNLPPYTATAYDTDPLSPTYWSGPFGQVPYFYEDPTIATQAQANAAAAGLLARTKGLTRSVSLTAVPNPALDVGDVIQVVYPDGTTERHIVDSVSIPLTATGTSAISTRSTDPTKE